MLPGRCALPEGKAAVVERLPFADLRDYDCGRCVCVSLDSSVNALRSNQTVRAVEKRVINSSATQNTPIRIFTVKLRGLMLSPYGHFETDMLYLPITGIER